MKRWLLVVSGRGGGGGSRGRPGLAGRNGRGRFAGPLDDGRGDRALARAARLENRPSARRGRASGGASSFVYGFADPRGQLTVNGRPFRSTPAAGG
jgi:hypothetical protein